MSRRTYNFPMRSAFRICTVLAVLGAGAFAQGQTDSGISVSTQGLPIASLWERYEFLLQAEGGVAPYKWAFAGRLPNGSRLETSGKISGIPQEVGKFDVIVLVSDNNGQTARRKLTLEVPNPLTIEWEHKASVNGQRIDGSIKVSNRSGRDFDLTFIVLAVNDIGRATAIGYQHFPLKAHTRDMSLPFGDTLSPGNYTVNVDLVGEEPVSNKIFRTRLVTPKETIAQGP